jgi:hypothetical protein
MFVFVDMKDDRPIISYEMVWKDVISRNGEVVELDKGFLVTMKKREHENSLINEFGFLQQVLLEKPRGFC